MVPGLWQRSHSENPLAREQPSQACDVQVHLEIHHGSPYQLWDPNADLFPEGLPLPSGTGVEAAFAWLVGHIQGLG